MNVTWYLYLTPDDLGELVKLQCGQTLKIKHENADCSVTKLNNGELEFEVYDELDMRDYR